MDTLDQQRERQKSPLSHPYMKYIQQLNMTECYNLMILAQVPYNRDTQIVYAAAGGYDKIKELQDSFAVDFPEEAEEIKDQAAKKLPCADCIIL